MLALPEGPPAEAPGWVSASFCGYRKKPEPEGRGCPFLSLSPCVPICL